MLKDQWVRSAVRSAGESIEAFTLLAAELAAGVEDGTVVLTEADKQSLLVALQMFGIQADRLRLQLPGHEEVSARKRAPA